MPEVREVHVGVMLSRKNSKGAHRLCPATRTHQFPAPERTQTQSSLFKQKHEMLTTAPNVFGKVRLNWS